MADGVIQQAKPLLATQSLHAAITRHEVASLRAAIEVAEGVAGVDQSLVEVSGQGQGTVRRAGGRWLS